MIAVVIPSAIVVVLEDAVKYLMEGTALAFKINLQHTFDLNANEFEKSSF